MPTMIEGYVSNGIADISKKYEAQWINESDSSDISAMIEETKKNIAFNNLSKTGILYHHRRTLKDAQMILLVNSHDSQVSSGDLNIEGRSVECWNAMNGEITSYPFTVQENKVNVSFNIQPKGSLLLCVTGKNVSEIKAAETTDKDIAATDTMTIKQEMPNVLTIDYCDLKIGKKIQKDMYYYNAMLEAFKSHGWNYNPWDCSVQFRSETIDKDTFKQGTGFEASYHFIIEKDAEMKSLQAVVERPQIFKVFINDKPVQALEGKWWVDKDFALYNIGDLVKEGENILTVKVDPFTLHAEIQPVFILGNFSLIPAKKSFTIGKAVSLKTGSWAKQGMPFYPFGVDYSQSFKTENTTAAKYFVQIDTLYGTVASVQVNGHNAGCIISQPYELDITHYIEPDVNNITVTVIGSLKNAFGPHHGNHDLGMVSPWRFRNGFQGGYPAGSDYWILPYGLNEPFNLICRINK